MKKRQFILVFFALAIVFSVSFFTLSRQGVVEPDITKISIAGKTFKVEILNTEAERIQGLSGREFLANDTVMLFVFEKEDKYGIWMKDMKFPIDIVWLDKNLEIVHIEKNISPETYPKVFYPTKSSLYVIEAVAGFSLENRINVNDRVEFVK